MKQKFNQEKYDLACAKLAVETVRKRHALNHDALIQEIIDKQDEINALFERLKEASPHLFKSNKLSRFEIPSIQEITDHIKIMSYSVDPVQFHSFYSSKGWMVGKNKMRCWKSALVTWDRKRKEENCCFNQAGNPANWNDQNTSFFDAMNSHDF